MLLLATLLAADPSPWAPPEPEPPPPATAAAAPAGKVIGVPADGLAPASFGKALPVTHPGYVVGSGFDKPPSLFEMEISVTQAKQPVFPEAARAAHLATGMCTVKVTIDRTGTPTDVQPAECAALWFPAASTAVRTWHFDRTPAPTKDTWSMVMPVKFEDKVAATK